MKLHFASAGNKLASKFLLLPFNVTREASQKDCADQWIRLFRCRSRRMLLHHRRNLIAGATKGCVITN